MWLKTFFPEDGGAGIDLKVKKTISIIKKFILVRCIEQKLQTTH